MQRLLPFALRQTDSTSHGNQRWREGRHRYRPPHETIIPSRYDIAPLRGDTLAKAFVIQHHYSRTYPAARFRFGLYRHGHLVGVAIYSHPSNDRVLTSVFRLPVRAAVELGRFVLLDDVEGNGESWFLARTFQHLREAGIRGVVSYSDPVPRLSASGTLVMPGHIGTIYQAHNARYLGLGTPRRLRLLPDGRAMSDRAIQKLRSGERGWRYAADQLERAGAPPAPEDADARRFWLHEQLHRLTRAYRHPGNHRYAWPLHRNVEILLDSRPYPKRARPSNVTATT